MKSIGLHNVKAFVDTGDIELAPLTLFVGQNSCGKSSFIRFPVVISQSISNEGSAICLHSNQPGTIDYGNFQDVLHQHKGDTFSFSFTEDFSKIANLGGAPKCKKKCLVRCTLSFTKTKGGKASEIIISSCKVEYNNDLAFEIAYEKGVYNIIIQKYISKGIITNTDISFSYESSDPMMLNYPYMSIRSTDTITKGIIMKYFNNDQSVLEAVKGLLFPPYIYRVNADRINNEEKQDKKIKLSKRQKDTCMRIYRTTEQTIDCHMTLLRSLIYDTRNMHYIGPFRNNPQRIYRLDESARNQVGHSGEYASDMLINDYIDQGILTKSVSKWFEESFGYSICVHELKTGDSGSGYYQITLQEADNNEERNIMDVGYGISQVLPIVIQLAEATATMKRNYIFDEFFVIEQPELHLHPAAQAKLAYLFTNAISKKNMNYRKILVETHSEHFIRALQVMIANPNHFLTNKMVKIYYVDRDKQGGSIIKEMKMTEEGQFIDEWPSGFFDKSFELSRELLKAINMRKRNGE